MTLELGDVIAQIGGASVVREHTPLNVPPTSVSAEVWSGTIPVGHVLAVEITINPPTMGSIVVVAADESWSEMHYAGSVFDGRLTLVTAPGHEGPVMVLVPPSPDAPYTATGITTTLIPT